MFGRKPPSFQGTLWSSNTPMAAVKISNHLSFTRLSGRNRSRHAPTTILSGLCHRPRITLIYNIMSLIYPRKHPCGITGITFVDSFNFSRWWARMGSISCSSDLITFWFVDLLYTVFCCKERISHTMGSGGRVEWLVIVVHPGSDWSMCTPTVAV